jgi:predicted Zn-dependent protease
MSRNRISGRPATLAALAAVAAAAAGCATNPATGESMLAFMSEGQEVQAGQEFKLQVAAQQGIYEDAALNAYVDSVGKALAAVSERPELPWSFQVVDDPVVNAFALPGGPIFLARGILAHFNSEAEMASVLGHEIGHITARHIVEAMSRQQLAQLGLIAGMIAVPDLAPYAQELSGAMGVLFLKFGRDDESQADELGHRYMTRAGYDPEAAVAMFEILERQRAVSGQSMPEWTSTHPDPGNRVAAARERAATDTIEGGTVRRDEYLRRIDGLVWGPDPREGYFLDERFVHPELAFEVTLPQGWQTANTKQAVLAGSPDQDAMFQLSAGQAQPDEAARTFFGGQGIRQTGSARRTIHGLPAIVATFAAQAQSGAIEGIAAFIRHGDLTYQLLGYAPSSRIGRHAATLERTIGSFAPVTDRSLLRVEPMRIDVVRVPERMTARRFHERYPSTVELETVLQVNGVDADDTIQAGTRMKRITGTGGPTGR